MNASRHSFPKIIVYILVCAAGGGILAFVACKAARSSFTHDEAYTYTRYVHLHFMDIISYNPAYTNNHILNTVLMKYSEALFGPSELALRLPNILSLVLYMIYCTRFFRGWHPLAQLAAFLLMTANPYMLEFFGLARGYGLSVALMLMALFHLGRFVKVQQKKDLAWFNAAALLACLANFSLLNFLVAALLTLNLFLLAGAKLDGRRFRFWQLNKMNALFVALAAAILYEPLRKTVGASFLDFGGKQGFVADTLQGLVRGASSGLSLPEGLALVLAYLIAIITAMSTLLIFYQYRQSNNTFFKEQAGLVLVNGILWLISGNMLLQHLLFQNDFYVGRFAIFLYPLVALHMLWLAAYLLRSKRVLSAWMAALLIPLLAFHTSRGLAGHPLSYSDWAYDKDTRAMLDTLSKTAGQDRQVPLRLGLSWVFEPVVNFYRETRQLHWLLPADRTGISASDEYDYAFKTDSLAKAGNTYAVLYASDDCHTMLIRHHKTQ